MTAVSKIKTFSQNENGAVAMVFGLAFIPLVMLVGCAIDIGRAIHANTKLSAAIDAAALASARALQQGKMTATEVGEFAFDYFSNNVRGAQFANFTAADFSIDINTATSTVTLGINGKVPTTFARITGVENVKVNPSAQAVFALRDIEVGLALDVTGSMGERIDGTAKITSLKSAFGKFANLMLPDTLPVGQKVRIGLAPYSAAINLGGYASDASDGRSTDGCVTERSTTARYSDATVTIGGRFNVRADGVRAIEDGRNTYVCPNARVVGLTDDRQTLIDSVNAYGIGGRTGGHFGAQWAWNLVSEEWGSFWGSSSAPAPYQQVADRKLIKAVILMTDGKFNTAYSNDTSTNQAVRLCEQMKARGIQVFSLAFGLDDADAVNTLKGCASGSENFANAANEDELDQAFARFAGKINALRLSN